MTKKDKNIYAAKYRKTHKEKIKEYQVLYRQTHKKELKEYRDSHKKEKKIRDKSYYSINKSKKNKRDIARYKTRRERQSVRRHHYIIFKCKDPHYRNYKGMPFFDSWNPDKGGSWENAETWIIENLGKKPNGKSSLHIVKHSLGFVPGNLAWAYPRQQSSEQMFKIITRQEHEIKELKEQISQLRKKECL